MNAKLFIVLVLIALVAVFIVQNAEVVQLCFLFRKLGMSRALIFVFLVMIGIAAGGLLRGHTHRKMQCAPNEDSLGAKHSLSNWRSASWWPVRESPAIIG
ncbi:MAG: hypothetical protein JSW48_00835 [Betaproteobacteria bacterium]|jgi:hypothetical protein|nr:MAG: hypothetical protein JSW48_00835 [Betaproteobacteria bacterium]